MGDSPEPEVQEVKSLHVQWPRYPDAPVFPTNAFVVNFNQDAGEWELVVGRMALPVMSPGTELSDLPSDTHVDVGARIILTHQSLENLVRTLESAIATTVVPNQDDGESD